MKEAFIRCLCADYRFHDLSVRGAPLVLQRGQTEWVPEAVARRSDSLAHAERIGAVSVEWRERSRVSKSPTPPWLKRKITRPTQASATPPTPSAPPPTPSAPPAVDPEVIAQRAESAAAKAAKEAVDRGMAEIKALLSAQSPGIPRDQLEAALRKVLPAGAAPAAPAAPTAPATEDDAPVFIPSDIVKQDAEAKIEIAAEASGGEGLDAAAKALKATKKKPARKRAPRKRKSATTKDVK